MSLRSQLPSQVRGLARVAAHYQSNLRARCRRRLKRAVPKIPHCRNLTVLDTISLVLERERASVSLPRRAFRLIRNLDRSRVGEPLWGVRRASACSAAAPWPRFGWPWTWCTARPLAARTTPARARSCPCASRWRADGVFLGTDIYTAQQNAPCA